MRGQRCILLHLDCVRQLLGLDLKLPHGGVVLKRRVLVLVDVAEHLYRIVLKLPCDVYIHVQVDSHDGLELPQGHVYVVLSVVEVGDGVCHGGLGPCVIKLRSLLDIVSHLRLAEVLYCVVVNFFIYFVSLLCKLDRIERLLDLGNHVQARRPGLLHCKFHVLAGYLDALP